MIRLEGGPADGKMFTIATVRGNPRISIQNAIYVKYRVENGVVIYKFMRKM